MITVFGNLVVAHTIRRLQSEYDWPDDTRLHVLLYCCTDALEPRLSIYITAMVNLSGSVLAPPQTRDFAINATLITIRMLMATHERFPDARLALWRHVDDVIEPQSPEPTTLASLPTLSSLSLVANTQSMHCVVWLGGHDGTAALVHLLRGGVNAGLKPYAQHVVDRLSLSSV